MHNVHITNGTTPNCPAEFTCHTHNGQSTVDYIASTNPNSQTYQDTAVLHGIADHDLLYTFLPQKLPATNQPGGGETEITYKWVIGENISSYSSSAEKWREYTNTGEFLDRFR